MIDHILYPLHSIQVYISVATHYQFDLLILCTLLTRIETVALVYFPLLQPSHIIKESVLGSTFSFHKRFIRLDLSDPQPQSSVSLERS